MKPKKPKVYMIGNAHIDPVWLWRWQEGYAEVRATYRSALDRIEQFDDFVFTTACAAYYKWIEDSEPEMFAEIQKAVAAGKWYIVGGWWIQPDCNIPSGESFSRHSLYSQRYFEEKFGVKATIGWNVDSFGHNGNLPQIYKKSGITAYIYMRPGPHEKKYPFKEGEPFIWRGVDGSEIIAYNIPRSYGFGVDGGLRRLAEEMALASDRGEFMLFYGVGNHGGGPTISSIERIYEFQAADGSVDFEIASPDVYFNKVKADLEKHPLPVVVGDLQHHATGCYASYVKVKALNRRAEQRLMCAEKTSVLAESLLSFKNDPEKYRAAWEKVLFNQFHDIMGGCSAKDAYTDAEEFYGQSLTIASEGYNQALQKITWQIDTDKGVRKLSKETDGRIWEIENKGSPVVVYNPLSWEVETPVYINYEGQLKSITDSDGNAVLYQVVNGRHLNGVTCRPNCVFTAKIPAFGWKTFWLYKNLEKPTGYWRKHLRATPFYIENENIRVEFDPETGHLRSIFDLRSGREFLSAPARPLVCDETELDTWGHIRTRFRNEIGDFRNAEITVVENGPVRARVCVKTTFGNSELEQLYTLYPESTDVEVIATLFWHEQHKLLKLAFPTNITNTEAVYEIPYGVIRKPADGEEQPAQAWGAVEGCDGRGLALINDGKYSYDVKEGEIRLTVIRSALYTDHSFGDNRDGLPRIYQEQGEHEFAYLIHPYTGGFSEGKVVRRGWELNSPVAAVMETYHKGSLPLTSTNCSVSADNVIISAMKKAEDGNGTIVRLYECDGKVAEARISLPSLGCDLKAEFTPFEIKTFRIVDGKAVETNLIED